MKNTLFASFTILAALAAPMAAQNQNRMDIYIPFDFTAGERTFSAGKYEVRTSIAPGTVMIQSIESRAAAALVVTPASKHNGRPATQDKVVFQRYGDRYFLSEVWREGIVEGKQVIKSGLEREVAATLASGKTPDQVVLFAGHR